MGNPAGKVISIFGDRMRKVRADGFVNLVTALGTARDKMSFNRFVRGNQLDVETLDAMYSEDDMAARVCDVVPEEELRQGYNIVVAPDADTEGGEALDDAASLSESVHDAADALDLANKVIEARVWGRVFGGGILLLGVDDGAIAEDGSLATPLNEKGIVSFDHINVLDRRYAHPLKFYSDPASAKFGLAETYLITPQASQSTAAAQMAFGTIEIHETRLVVFGGTRTSIRTRQEMGGWDTSVIQRMNTTLSQFGVSWDALAHMLQDASQGVFKMKGFIDALASDETSLVMQRLNMMDMSRSVARALVLDEEGESFERQNYSWSGIKDPFEMLMLRLAAASRMPVTVLMGQSPAGLSATGESDIRWFYDTIRTSQNNEVKPALEYILRLVMLAKSGPTNGQVPESWSVTFPSLWQMSPTEQAAVEKSTAERDAIYMDRGVLTPEEVAISRFTADGWKADTLIKLEDRRALVEGDLDDDFEDTPTLEPGDPAAMPTGGDPAGGEPATGDDVAKQALNGAQTGSLVDVATKVQAGELAQSSGIAIVLAANPVLSPAEAAAIVGQEDPKKVAAREKALASLPANAPPPPPNAPPKKPPTGADPDAELDDAAE
jgi:phage-related protein (TIGR01555 family)